MSTLRPYLQYYIEQVEMGEELKDSLMFSLNKTYTHCESLMDQYEKQPGNRILDMKLSQIYSALIYRLEDLLKNHKQHPGLTTILMNIIVGFNIEAIEAFLKNINLQSNLQSDAELNLKKLCEQALRQNMAEIRLVYDDSS